MAEKEALDWDSCPGSGKHAEPQRACVDRNRFGIPKSVLQNIYGSYAFSLALMALSCYSSGLHMFHFVPSPTIPNRISTVLLWVVLVGTDFLQFFSVIVSFKPWSLDHVSVTAFTANNSCRTHYNIPAPNQVLSVVTPVMCVLPLTRRLFSATGHTTSCEIVGKRVVSWYFRPR